MIYRSRRLLFDLYFLLQFFLLQTTLLRDVQEITKVKVEIRKSLRFMTENLWKAFFLQLLWNSFKVGMK